MSKFAKLFEIGEEQLLVMTQQNDAGNPTVVCVTDIDGVEVSLASTYKLDGHSQKDLDQAWVSADKYFGAFNQKDAERIHSILIKQYKMGLKNYEK